MHCQNLGPEAQMCVCACVCVHLDACVCVCVSLCAHASVPWPSSLPVLAKLPIVVIFLF